MNRLLEFRKFLSFVFTARRQCFQLCHSWYKTGSVVVENISISVLSAILMWWSRLGLCWVRDFYCWGLIVVHCLCIFSIEFGRVTLWQYYLLDVCAFSERAIAVSEDDKVDQCFCDDGYSGFIAFLALHTFR